MDDLFSFSVALGGLAIFFLIYNFSQMIMLCCFRFHNGGEEMRMFLIWLVRTLDDGGSC